MSNNISKKRKEVTYTLLYPIKFGEEVIESLTFKKVKFKHLKKLDAVDSSKGLTYMSKYIELSTGIPMSAMDDLEQDDVIELLKIASDFLT